MGRVPEGWPCLSVCTKAWPTPLFSTQPWPRRRTAQHSTPRARYGCGLFAASFAVLFWRRASSSKARWSCCSLRSCPTPKRSVASRSTAARTRMATRTNRAEPVHGQEPQRVLIGVAQGDRGVAGMWRRRQKEPADQESGEDDHADAADRAASHLAQEKIALVVARSPSRRRRPAVCHCRQAKTAPGRSSTASVMPAYCSFMANPEECRLRPGTREGTYER